MRTMLGLIGCALVSWPVLAQGGFSGPGRYSIFNIKSGKVLDLDRNDQTTVIQFSPRGTDNQTWEIRSAGGGFYYLRNGMNGYALDVGRARNSDPLRGVPFNGGDTQQWRLQRGKDGNALIISRLGPSIDIPDGSDRDGVRVQVYDPNGDSNQRFSFQLVRGGLGGNWERGRDGDDRGGPSGVAGAITCASNNGERVYCEVDTHNGVRLTRQISGSPCVQDRTWGYDNRGIWVDRGCRAEFIANTERGYGGGRGGNTIVCASNNGERVYCEVETRDRNVQLTRQMSGSPCRQGETWGWDRRGIWVDRGCRAEFVVGSR